MIQPAAVSRARRLRAMQRLIVAGFVVAWISAAALGWYARGRADDKGFGSLWHLGAIIGVGLLVLVVVELGARLIHRHRLPSVVDRD